ncbi:MAG: alpha/beta hydrolase [Gammaproteobacteria bacterium]|nr:alpha/beta hydrolase [Gammaproteobacteria bacterium]
MNTAVATPPDLSIEIPADCAPTPQWFEDALATPREEGWVDSAGCPIHYFRWGDPARPGVLLLHGFLAHSRCFAFIAPFLAQDYHVVAYDFSGMGDSGEREAYPNEVRLQELKDVATHTGLFANGQKPTIIAHSYGGSVGLIAMEHCHEEFAGLVICDLMTLRPERLKEHLGDRDPSAPQRPRRPNKVYPDYATAKGRFVLSPPQKVNEPYLFDYMAFHSLKEVSGGWSWKFHPSVFERDGDPTEHLLAQTQRIVKAPGRIVIVYGEQSLLFDADSADYIRECGGTHIPMIEIPDARHHLMLDQPLAFVSVLRATLAL